MGTIGTIPVAALTLAITQALKELFNIEGNTNRVVALVIATLLTFASAAIELESFTLTPAQWVELVVRSIAGGLAAIGAFDYSKEIARTD